MRPTCLAVGFVFIAVALPAVAVETVSVAQAVSSDTVSVADASERFTIQLGRSAKGIKGPVRILERGQDGTLSILETIESSDPQKVQLLEGGNQLAVQSTQPIPPGSTWVFDLTGVCGCRPYTPGPPVRGLWKSSTGSLPVKDQTLRIVQACACDPLVAVSPVAFSAPAAAPVAAVAATNIGWIILGTAVVVGAIVGIATSSSGGGGGSGSSRNLLVPTVSR